ncbi:FecR family protein [Terrihabitans sp. B22-R8]|uniref:FecR family protein n=1 Tax=Terrihabitans sp. B22-R8 TaxID=3425128 RepID=UPI00403C044F
MASERASPSIPEPLFREAALWLARLDDPTLDDRTRAAFHDWLARDDRHLAAYDQAERVWTGASANTPSGPRDDAAIEALVRGAKRGRGRKRAARTLAAGLCALMLAGGGEWVRRGGLDDLRSDYVTAPGARRIVELADGSVIRLNTDSALAVELEPRQRRVRLFRGEAFFEVAHDPARPFVVVTDHGETRVTGTAFNLRETGDETRVSLVEGRVRLSPLESPGNSVALAAGQEAEVRPDRVGMPRAFDAESATAWQRGQIVFFQTRLADVVEELNRYQRGRIMVLGERLRAQPVTGVFDSRDPDQAIANIEATLGVSALRLGGALTILR